MVCAGGGVAGAAYEVGCLLALEELLDRPTTSCDVYLGISAGAVVTALLANGVPPAEMAAQFRDGGGTLYGVPTSRLFRASGRHLWAGALALPRLAAGFLGYGAASRADAAYAALERLPDGFLDNAGVRECVANAIHGAAGTESFDELRPDLYILAVDIDSGEVVAFGEPGRRDVPIPLAVQASSAIPALCRPVPIGDRAYVDGAVRKTAHVRRVIEDGASLVFCINPMVPIGARPGGRSFGHLMCETIRLTLHGRMQSALRAYEQEYPNVDILLLEPTREEIQSADLTMVRADEIGAVFELGYRGTVSRFRARAEEWGRKLARHGVHMRDPFHVPESAPEPPAVPRPQGVARRRLDRALRQLRGVLAHRAPAPAPAKS